MLHIILIVLLTLIVSVNAGMICNPNGDIWVFASYNGGRLEINANVLPPSGKIYIGVTGYEGTVIGVGGYYSNKVIIYMKGYNGKNGVCGSIISNNIKPMYGDLGLSIISTDSSFNDKCGDTASDIEINKFYEAFPNNNGVRAYQTQTECWSPIGATRIFDLSTLGNCCDIPTQAPTPAPKPTPSPTPNPTMSPTPSPTISTTISPTIPSTISPNITSTPNSSTISPIITSTVPTTLPQVSTQLPTESTIPKQITPPNINSYLINDKYNPIFKMEWTVDTINNRVNIEIAAPTTGYICLGLSAPDKKAHDHVDVACGGLSSTKGEYLEDQYTMLTEKGYDPVTNSSNSQPVPDLNNNLKLEYAKEVDGMTIVKFSRALITADSNDINFLLPNNDSSKKLLTSDYIAPIKYNCFYAVSDTDDIFVPHSHVTGPSSAKQRGSFPCALYLKDINFDMYKDQEIYSIDCNKNSCLENTMACILNTNTGISSCPVRWISDDKIPVFGLYVTGGLIFIYLCLRLYRQFVKKIEQLPGMFGELMLVLSILLALLDVYNDILFLITIKKNESYGLSYWNVIYIISISTLVMPFFINLIVLIKLLRKEEKLFWVWLEKHTATTYPILCLACVNLSIGCLLCSDMLGLGMFSSNLPKKRKHIFNAYALINVVLEDIPQTIIKIYIIKITGSSMLTTISFISTGMLLFVSLVKKIFSGVIAEKLDMVSVKANNNGVVIQAPNVPVRHNSMSGHNKKISWNTVSVTV